jgi:hypothetical protein
MSEIHISPRCIRAMNTGQTLALAQARRVENCGTIIKVKSLVCEGEIKSETSSCFARQKNKTETRSQKARYEVLDARIALMFET